MCCRFDEAQARVIEAGDFVGQFRAVAVVDDDEFAVAIGLGEKGGERVAAQVVAVTRYHEAGDEGWRVVDERPGGRCAGGCARSALKRKAFGQWCEIIVTVTEPTAIPIMDCQSVACHAFPCGDIKGCTTPDFTFGEGIEHRCGEDR